MLKINLLPRYIYQRREIRQAAFLCVLAFVLVVACMVTWWIMLGRKESGLEIRVAEMEQKADQVKALKELVRIEEAKIPPVQEKVDFIEDIMDYNTACPKLYKELAKYTYSRVLYRSLGVSGNQLTITGYCRSVGDCGRFLLNLYLATHIFSSVSVSGVPGYRRGEMRETAMPASISEAGVGPPDQLAGLPRGFEFTVTCTLVEPIAAPTYGAARGAGAGPGVPDIGPRRPGVAPPPPDGAGVPPPPTD